MPTCLITGANRGLGLEFARQYAADGWEVIATSRSLVYADDLKAIEGNVELHALDVSDFARIEALGQSLRNRPIDLLINNAGVHGDPTEAAFTDLDYRTWTEVMRINVMAPLKMCAVFVEHVAKSKQKRIATLSSKMGSMGENTSGGTYIYRSSKAAVNAVMRSLALDLKARGIALVILHPGWVRTDMGGPHGLIDPPESITGMRDVIANLSLETTGRFVNYDGSEVPW